ncbi:sporulation membrane protein YtaF [Paenibacillus sp. GP183]|uniref:sporulation membrane protein YtaF n=1 Tax=Paenibacillus sp. GP183 TaxID=1882751 RepID=UPI00089C674B|nr:sporulation membrane protein YtaF [Paenibacillus sp. GP183]SEB80638.1 putative sporulation protein YtaF [Paenibacillus sp. GP183]
MLPMVSLILLAFAVSLDGFGVGVMYGLRQIRIPLLSVGIISLCSGVIIFGSMQIGLLLSSWIHPAAASKVGATILIGIGLWALFQLLHSNKHVDSESSAAEAIASEADSLLSAPKSPTNILYIELKRFGLVIQILKTPAAADVDRSGNISASEATLLGIALSLDAFGAGIGAALIGLAPVLTALVITLSSGLFIAIGLRMGLRFAGTMWMRKLSILPGCVLILMGILKWM